MNWPQNKDFAFTIIDDTDNATIRNIKPVYDLLFELGFRTTKTVWVYPPRDHFKGQSLSEDDYVELILKLKEQGFGLALHGVGSGDFVRDEIKRGIEIFEKKLDLPASMHINHAQNSNNIYWGKKRFYPPVSWIMHFAKSDFYGENPNSEYFWGDIFKEKVKFTRNLVFSEINTLRCDPLMPYREANKDRYSNYWFSSSDGHTVKEFNDLTSPKNIQSLREERGCSIIYTHFASGFVTPNGDVDPTFRKQMTELSKQNGWFVPAQNVLELLLESKATEDLVASRKYLRTLGAKWLISRIIKKFKYGK